MITRSDTTLQTHIYKPEISYPVVPAGGYITLDTANYRSFEILLDNNINGFDFTEEPEVGTNDSFEIVVKFRQDAIGNRTVSWNVINITGFYLGRTAGSYGTFPTEFPTLASNSIDIVKILLQRETSGTFGYISIYALNMASYV